MKSNRKNGKVPRTTPYNFTDLTAYAIAFYYLELFKHLTTVTSSALHIQEVLLLHRRDVVKQIVYSMPHTIHQRTVLINKQVELCFEQVSYPYDTQGIQKIKYSGWSAIMATVIHDQREIQISCRPNFELRHIILPAQVEQWLARNRSMPVKKLFQKLKERFIPMRVLPSYQKNWEEIIKGAIISSMMP